MKHDIPDTVKLTMKSTREDGTPVFNWEEKPEERTFHLSDGQFLIVSFRAGELHFTACDGYSSAGEPLARALNDARVSFAMEKFAYPAQYADYDPYTVNPKPCPFDG